MANAVAAFASGLKAYREGPKNCPSFYNPKCEIQYVAGPLTLCAPCRRKLKEAEKIEIVEKLLKAYP